MRTFFQAATGLLSVVTVVLLVAAIWSDATTVFPMKLVLTATLSGFVAAVTAGVAGALS